VKYTIRYKYFNDFLLNLEIIYYFTPSIEKYLKWKIKMD